jgi:tRNA dimethylallyltransferase
MRDSLRAEAAAHGNEYMLERLRIIDPVTANRLHPNDLNRIIRAIEVHAITGLPISHFHLTAGSVKTAHDVRILGLTMPRAVLYERIEHRIDCWLEQGLVEEVRGLLNQGYSRDLPAMKGLGYKHISGYLEGEYDLDFAIAMLKRDTRRYAKRQFTWFRGVREVQWIEIDGRSAGEVARQIAQMIA